MPRILPHARPSANRPSAPPGCYTPRVRAILENAMHAFMRSKALTGALCLLSIALLQAQRGSARPAVDSLSGVVRGANGPEAGVWVIAETKDLPTNSIKIVAPDDRGRFMLPELPAATYAVWVRGYGLVDSMPIRTKP